MSQGRVYGSAFTPLSVATFVVGAPAPANTCTATQQFGQIDTAGAPVVINNMANTMQPGDKVTLSITNVANTCTISSAGNIATTFNRSLVLSAVTDWVVLHMTSATTWAVSAFSIGDDDVQAGTVAATTTVFERDNVQLQGGAQALTTATGLGTGARVVCSVAGGSVITLNHGVGANQFNLAIRNNRQAVLNPNDSFEAVFNGTNWDVTSVNIAAEALTVLAVGANNLVPLDAVHTINGGGVVNTVTQALFGEGTAVRFVRGDTNVVFRSTAGANGFEARNGKVVVLSAAGDFIDLVQRNGRWYETASNTTGDLNATVIPDGNNEWNYIDSGDYTLIAGPDIASGLIGGAFGDTITLVTDGGGDLTIQHDNATAGNAFLLPDAQAIVLASVQDYATFIFNGVAWSLVSWFMTDFNDRPSYHRTIRTRFTAASLTATGTPTQTLTIATMPVGAEIKHVFVNVATSAGFSAGTTTGLNAQVGIAGTIAGFRGNVALQTASPVRLYGTIGVGADVSGGGNVIATFTATGGTPDIDEVNAGSWDFYVTYEVLPNVNP
jgi:hypothetical protein